MLIIGAVALIAFGPDQLPKVARRAGQVMRDVQNSSQSFIREMERAAEEPAPPYVPHEPVMHDTVMHDTVVHEPVVPPAPLETPAAAHERVAPHEPAP